MKTLILSAFLVFIFSSRGLAAEVNKHCETDQTYIGLLEYIPNANANFLHPDLGEEILCTFNSEYLNCARVGPLPQYRLFRAVGFKRYDEDYILSYYKYARRKDPHLPGSGEREYIRKQVEIDCSNQNEIVVKIESLTEVDPLNLHPPSFCIRDNYWGYCMNEFHNNEQNNYSKFGEYLIYQAKLKPLDSVLPK